MTIKNKFSSHWFKSNITLLARLGVFFVLLVLGACDSVVEKTAVSINTNAYYTVYQDTLNGEWQTRLTSYNNPFYRTKTISFTLPTAESPFGIAFVCPSVGGTKPHEVYAFFATPGELDEVDFNCKRAQEDIVMRPIYGKIQGIKIAEPNSPQGEKAFISLDKAVSVRAWEAYAATAQAGSRDIMAYKGQQAVSGEDITPEVFYIKREAARGVTSEAARVDIDFTGKDIGAYTALFDPNNLSTVTVSGLAEGELASSKVGFLSNKKSFLTLKETQETSFSFLPVPLEIFTGTLAGFTNKNEFNPGEGHELEVAVKDDAGKPLRVAHKIFTLSNGVNHQIVLPKALDSAPIVGLKNKGEVQQLLLNWSAFQDNAGRETKVYRWVLQGLAADADKKHPAEFPVGDLTWIVHITPGWLSKVANSTRNYAVILPEAFKVNLTDSKGEPQYTWRQEWGFKVSTPLNWEFVAISVKGAFTAKDIVDYYLNRDFNILSEGAGGEYSALNFEYAESFARASVSP